MDSTMDSIKEILHSKKFLRDAPDRLENLIRRIQREDYEPEATAFSPMFPTDIAKHKNHKSNWINLETKEKNAA